jgi:hypothetical protein
VRRSRSVVQNKLDDHEKFIWLEPQRVGEDVLSDVYNLTIINGRADQPGTSSCGKIPSYMVVVSCRFIRETCGP